MSDEARGIGPARELRTYMDLFERSQAVLDETEPRACTRCGRRDTMVEAVRHIKLDDRRTRDVAWWHCTACDSAADGLAWGYPVIGDFFSLRRWYARHGGPGRALEEGG